MVIIPVMQNLFEEVGITPFWHGQEKIPANDFAASHQPVVLYPLLGISGQGGEVEEDAAHLRVRFQDGREEHAVSAAYVNDLSNA